MSASKTLDWGSGFFADPLDSFLTASFFGSAFGVPARCLDSEPLPVKSVDFSSVRCPSLVPFLGMLFRADCLEE